MIYLSISREVDSRNIHKNDPYPLKQWWMCMINPLTWYWLHKQANCCLLIKMERIRWMIITNISTLWQEIMTLKMLKLLGSVSDVTDLLTWQYAPGASSQKCPKYLFHYCVICHFLGPKGGNTSPWNRCLRHAYKNPVFQISAKVKASSSQQICCT